MGAILGLGALAMAGAVMVGVFGLIWLVLKLVFLPVRLVIGLVKVVLGVVGGLLGMIALVAVAPLVLLGVGGALFVGLFVAAVAILLPLVPFILLGLVVWSFLKRPAVPA
jgi:hypothetical protein